MGSVTSGVELFNPLLKIYKEKTNVILFAHSLVGTPRGKSANGLMIHSNLFNVVAIIDIEAEGKDTAKICQGVASSIPIYSKLEIALKNHHAKALIFLIPIDNKWHNEIEYAINNGLDLINTSFNFIKNDAFLLNLINKKNINYFDLRDLAHLQAYPDTEILNRQAKVIFVTGTDCAIGKRVATYELMLEAKSLGINATMLATGQTGLLLGEQGTVIDSLIMEFSNGVISQQVKQLCDKGYELIFVEGQSDIFHPAYSIGSLSLLHGSNPDCIIIVHDESRKTHKGFDSSPLYGMHPLKRYIEAFEIMSLPCGPVYKTVGIATIGDENINLLKNQIDLPVADVRKEGGPKVLLEAVLKYLHISNYNEKVPINQRPCEN